MQSKELFERTIRNPYFENTHFVLVLNKFDLFEEKISRVDISTCEWFSDFSPVKAANHNNDQLIIGTSSLLLCGNEIQRVVCFHHQQETVCVEAAGDDTFKYIREVLKWDQEKEDKCVVATVEDSFYSTKVSSRQFVR